MEKKVLNQSECKSSNLTLENRNKLTITGVLEVINFDDVKISLTTILGKLLIKGTDLKMNKLDVQNGDVIVSGKIISMIYTGKGVKKNNISLIKRIFK